MAKTKFDFISDLLVTNRFNSKQKERLYKLVSMEIKDAQSTDQIILKGIEEIKKHLSSNIIENENNSIPKANESDKSSYKNDNLPKYKNPKALNNFLLAYNQDPILKTTCHLIDNNELENILKITNVTEYNFEKHYSKIIETFSNLETQHKNANYKVKALIRGYLTGKNYKGEKINGWSTSPIKINWNTSELLEWAKHNPTIPPNPDEDIVENNENIGFEFEAFQPNYSNKRIQTFSELVIYFKYLFHIRSDNSLKNIIKQVNNSNKWNEEIHFEIDHPEFWDNIEVFTDVDKLIQAYKEITKLILEVKDKNNLPKPKIKLSFKEEDNNVVFSIHHLNTVYLKSLSSFLNKPIGQIYSNLINNQLNGLCDFILRADFSNNEFAEINLWNGKDIIKTSIDRFKGVEHILILKK